MEIPVCNFAGKIRSAVAQTDPLRALISARNLAKTHQVGETAVHALRGVVVGTVVRDRRLTPIA